MNFASRSPLTARRGGGGGEAITQRNHEGGREGDGRGRGRSIVNVMVMKQRVQWQGVQRQFKVRAITWGQLGTFTIFRGK